MRACALLIEVQQTKIQAIFDESEGESLDDDSLISLADDDFFVLERGVCERERT